MAVFIIMIVCVCIGGIIGPFIISANNEINEEYDRKHRK